MVTLYLDTKKMIFDEDGIEHEIVLKASIEEFYGYDIKLKHSKKLIIREEKTWNSFPLYEIVDKRIIEFDYTKYAYFTDTDRRIALAFKINDLYNPSSEAKILRTSIKRILNNLGIVDEKFEKYNTKIERIITNNPKEKR